MPSIAEVTELNKEASLQQEEILNPGTDQNINEDDSNQGGKDHSDKTQEIPSSEPLVRTPENDKTTDCGETKEEEKETEKPCLVYLQQTYYLKDLCKVSVWKSEATEQTDQYIIIALPTHP
ncbi:hypothetical protein P8452_32988 [Trifolium repens]|nr:hypothetical protein P8452_32988 [Trifolium repens]